MLGGVVWDRASTLVTGRRSWLIAVAIVLLSVAFMALMGANASAGQSPVLVPPSSQSARAAQALRQFPDGDRASALLVITRTDGSPLTPADLRSADEARDRMQTVPEALPAAFAPLITSPDGKAAIATVSLRTDLSGFALSDAVKALRAAAAHGLPSQLTSHVTGGPAFGADIANAFSGANITLLVVTALVVALLLITTYRSPILWLVPLTVIGLADRVATAVGTAVADADRVGV
jgi:RND superfamily putative drug exporter